MHFVSLFAFTFARSHWPSGAFEVQLFPEVDVYAACTFPLQRSFLVFGKRFSFPLAQPEFRYDGATLGCRRFILVSHMGPNIMSFPSVSA